MANDMQRCLVVFFLSGGGGVVHSKGGSPLGWVGWGAGHNQWGGWVGGGSSPRVGGWGGDHPLGGVGWGSPERGVSSPEGWVTPGGGGQVGGQGFTPGAGRWAEWALTPARVDRGLLPGRAVGRGGNSPPGWAGAGLTSGAGRRGWRSPPGTRAGASRS